MILVIIPGKTIQENRLIGSYPIPENFRTKFLFRFFHVRHMTGTAVHRLAYQVPRQVGGPAQSLIHQVGIPHRHGGALVGQKTLQDVQIDFTGCC